MFGDLFGGSGGFSASTFEEDGEFEDFVHILEQDNIKSFKSMFRNLGKNYRPAKGKNGMRSRATKQSKRAAKFEDDEFMMMDEMMAMMMMGDPEMAGFGFGGPMPPGMGKQGGKKASKGKKTQKNEESDDGWETDSGEEEIIEPKKQENKPSEEAKKKDTAVADDNDSEWSDCSN